MTATGGYSLTFMLVGLPKIMTNGSRRSWRSTWPETTKWKNKVYQEVYNRRPLAPLRRAQISFTRFSSMECDYDNLVASFKAIQDGLVRAGVLENDKPSNLPNPKYAWQKCPKGKGHIMVEVREIEEVDCAIN